QKITLPLGSKALVVEAAERFRSHLKPPDHEPEHKRSHADSRHPKRSELTQRDASRAIEDIRRADGDVLPHGRYLRQEDRVDAVGAGFEVLPRAHQAFLDRALVHVHIDPGVDYGVEASGTRSGLDRGNTLRDPVGVNQTARAMVTVFDVRPAGAGARKAIDEFLR